MHLFYTPDITNGLYALPLEESRHCQKVLRLKEGDTIHLTDGQGNLYRVRIIDAQSRQVQVEVVEKHADYNGRPYHIHLAVAPTKNIDRFEWFLEKATEIGIDEITPLLCEHSERKLIRIDRLEKVIIAAMKQSLKAYKPILNEMVSFEDFVRKNSGEGNFIAHYEEPEPEALKSAYKKGTNAKILIGPEGDFSASEMLLAKDQGFKMVSLGNTRLRTETAAVVACHTIYLLNC